MAETLIAGNDQRTDVLVPKGFWWAEGHEALDQSWEVGDFSTWIDRKLHVRAFGVWFYRPDLQRMIPRSFEKKATPERKNSGRTMSKDWPEWVAELAAYIHEKGIPAGRGSEGQDELIAAIDQRLMARDLSAPGRSTVQEAARAVLIRLRQAGK